MATHIPKTRAAKQRQFDHDTLQKSLDKHRREWNKCDRCPLHEHRRKAVLYRFDMLTSQALPKNAAPPIDSLLIGEAPGLNENDRGLPFVGPAGKKAQSMMDDVVMSLPKPLRRNFVYAYTNLVACAPFRTDGIVKNLGTPHADEIEVCMPRILDMIALLQPRTIVYLGKVTDKSATAKHLRKTLGTPWIMLQHPSWVAFHAEDPILETNRFRTRLSQFYIDNLSS